MNQPTNSDWKTLTRLKTVALDRLCKRALEEIANRSTANSKTNHERYLSVFDCVHQFNGQIANAFDDHRRSTALLNGAKMLSMGLLEPSEVEEFSQEFRDRMQQLSQVISGNGNG